MIKLKLLIATGFVLVLAGAGFGQSHEFAVSVGALRVSDRDTNLPPGFIRTGSGVTYQFNYAQRFFDGRLASLHYEFPVVVTPRTEIDSSNAFSPRSYSSVFVTPGLKLKLLPGFPYSPYGVAGVGIARFNSSDTTVAGGTNTEDRSATRAVFNYGVGLDIKVFPFVSVRGEVRDLYSGNPRFNSELIGNRQHNTLFSAGVVLRF